MWGTKRNRKVKGRPRNRRQRGWGISGLVAIFKFSVGVFFLTVLSLSFILTHDVVTQCDFFRSKKIQISGQERLSESEVLSQAGIERGGNTLAINLNLVRKRLLCHPWIAQAQVTRELPDSIIIRIKEQEPLAIVDLGGKFIINTAGDVFKVWEEKDPRNLPFVTGLDFSDICLQKETGSPSFEALMSILNLGQKGSRLFADRPIKEVHIDPDLGLTLYPVNGKKAIKLGYRNFEEKLRFLETILNRFDQQQDWSGVDGIDLANLNRVVITPAKGETHIGVKEGIGAGT